MSQGGGRLYGVMVVRVLGSVASSVAAMTSWAGLWWGFIYLLAGLPSRSTDTQRGGALGLQQEEMMPPSRPCLQSLRDALVLVCSFFLCAGSQGK